jgi:hypothetical protein
MGKLYFTDASSDNGNGNKGGDDGESNSDKKDEEEKKGKGEYISDSSVSKNNQSQQVPKQVKAKVMLVAQDSKEKKKYTRRSRRDRK